MVLNVCIMIPEKIYCTITVEELILPTTTGAVGILDGHAPLITAIETPGILRIKKDKMWTPLILFGGVVLIQGENVTILTCLVDDLSKIEFDKAKEELEQAKLAVENLQTESKSAKIKANLRLRKALVRFEGIKFLSKLKEKQDSLS